MANRRQASASLGTLYRPDFHHRCRRALEETWLRVHMPCERQGRDYLTRVVDRNSPSVAFDADTINHLTPNSSCAVAVSGSPFNRRAPRPHYVQGPLWCNWQMGCYIGYVSCQIPEGLGQKSCTERSPSPKAQVPWAHKQEDGDVTVQE